MTPFPSSARRDCWDVRFVRLQAMGIVNVDPSSLFQENKYRPCLQEFYADWAPDKLGTLDETLKKYEGREKQMFAKLGKKYGKKYSIAKCS